MDCKRTYCSYYPNFDMLLLVCLLVSHTLLQTAFAAIYIKTNTVSCSLYSGTLVFGKANVKNISHTVWWLSAVQNQYNSQSFWILYFVVLLGYNCLYSENFKVVIVPPPFTEASQYDSSSLFNEMKTNARITNSHTGAICMNDQCYQIYTPIMLLCFCAHSKILPLWSLKYVDD